jgi:hypothetical protein
MTIPNHKHHLAPRAQQFYVDQETILASHPSGVNLFPHYPAFDAAAILVGERHAKSDLIDLVGHLLVKLHEAQQAPAALDALKAALKGGDAYAWSWHCNIAMAVVDAGTNAADKHRLGNEGAAIFMRRVFDVDTSQFPEYRAFTEAWALMTATVDGAYDPATQPGSPEFDGAEAYEAHLAATVGDTRA